MAVSSSPAQHLNPKTIIELVSQRLRNSEIAHVVETTENVVKSYLVSIYDKIGVWRGDVPEATATALVNSLDSQQFQQLAKMLQTLEGCELLHLAATMRSLKA